MSPIRHRLLVTTIALISLGLIALESYKEGHLSFWNVLGHLGMAGIIAIVLERTLDSYLREKLGREVATDTAADRIAFNVPELIRKEIKALCLLPLCRESVFQHFVVENVVDEPSLVRVTLSIEYSVRNLTDQYQPYMFRVALTEVPYPGHSSKVNRVVAEGVRSKSKKTKTGDFDLPGEKLTLREISRATSIWEREVLIPPASTVLSRFWAEMAYTAPAQHETALFTEMPVAGWKVQITYPTDLVVELASGHRDWSKVKPKPTAHRPTTWDMPFGFTAGSGLAIEWKRMPP